MVFTSSGVEVKMRSIEVRFLLVAVVWHFCSPPIAVAVTRPWSLGFNQEPVDTQFAQNRSAILNCSSKGHPTPTVTWRYARDQKLITTNITGLRYILPNGSLYFPPFSKENLDASIHQADYQCLAENIAGKIISRISKLQAVIVQQYDVYAADAIVVQGNTAVIRSVVPDAVLPYVRVESWRKRDQILTLEGRYSLMPSGDLVISNVKEEDTEEMFVCTTVNILTGEKWSSNPAKVFLKTADQKIPVKMTSRAFNISVNVGETAKLQCTAHAFPVPQYVWSKDGVNEQDRSRFYTFAGGSLRIDRTRYEDQGVYLCTASNSEGSVTMAVSLSVRDPLKFKVRPVSKSAKVSDGGVVLECGISGQPTPSVTWYKDAQPVNLDSRIGMTKHFNTVQDRWDFNLSFTDVMNKDSGTYQCFADNGVDVIQSSASFIRDAKIPTISTSSPTVTLNPNQPLRLSCQASAMATPDITWKLDGEPLVSGYHGYTMIDKVRSTGSVDSAKNSTLRVQAVSVKNGGKYRCGACSVVGCSSKEIVVHVRGGPVITNFILSTNAIKSRPARLLCVVKGYPGPTVTWTKDGASLSPHHAVNSDNTLVISDVQISDRGRYKCRAANTHGQTENTAVLNVLVPPEPKLALSNDLVAGGSKQSKLTCDVAILDNKPYNVTWLKDGQLIRESDDLQIVDIPVLFSSFIIFKQVDKSQAGKYTCIAASAEGTAEAFKEIIVYVPPRVTQKTAEQRVLKTYTTHLTCKATGYPPPRIDWSKYVTGSFDPIEYTARVEKMLNGTLLIRNVTKADEGQYSCTAVSLKGAAVSEHVRLHVHAVPATISSAPINRSGRVSHGITVSCVAIGNLPIELRWYNGSTEMKTNSRVTMTTKTKRELYLVNGTLHVDNLVLQDTKSYSCSVKNSFGEDKETFRITAQDIPSPPSRPNFRHIGPKSLDIVWSPGFDGNSPIITFIIEYKVEGGKWEKKFVSVSPRSLELTSLKPASNYLLRVYAQNALGVSKAGVQNRVTTKEAAPSKPPTITNITAISATEIFVEWKPPPKESRNGLITRYYIACNKANTAPLKRIPISAQSGNSYVITKLKPWTEYNVVMQAATGAGSGPTTPTRLEKTMEDVPSKPPHTIMVKKLSSTKIEITWERPTTDSLNGELLGYKVRYYKESDPTKKLEKKTDRSSKLILKDLGKFTTYRISVLAYTRVGDGVASDETIVTTEEDRPGPPHDVRAVPVSKEVIRVLWKPPLEPNGIIREYSVSYSVSPRSPDATFSILGNYTSKYLPLEADTMYYFWVIAKTTKGYGNTSKVVHERTVDKIAANIFDKQLPTVYAKRSGTAVLNCEAYGYPMPTIQWKRNNRVLSDTNKYKQLENGSLKILQLQKANAGEYMCTASNNLDTTTVVRRLKVQVPPMPPINILIEALASSSALNITWTPGFDGDSRVSEFLLEFKSKGGAWEPVRVSHSKQYYVHNMQSKGVQYFRMSAVNEIGQGKKSEVYKITFKGPGFIDVKEFSPEDEVGITERRTFYHNPAILGTLIGVSVLVVAVLIFLSLLAYRGGYIDLKKVGDWRQRVFGQSSQRSSRRGHGNQTEEGPPTSGPMTDSVCTIERLPTPDGSEISITGNNYPIPFCYPHDTILEEDFAPQPPPYQSSTRIHSGIITRHPPPDADSNSDTSSEISCSRPVYHRPTLHTNEATARTRRYMMSAEHRASVHRSIRSLNGTPRVGILGFRGHADGRSELDTTPNIKGFESSNPELRYSTMRPLKIHGLSHESIPPVYVRSPSSVARDSGLGPSEFGQSSTHSRRSSNSSQVLPLTRPTPSPQRRDSSSSRESNSFPLNGNKLSASRERKAYDSTSSECSSSRDELMAALEFGKRNNLDKFYGIPTLETTSPSSEATNTSSDLDGVCTFSASPRLSGHGCLAPVPVRPRPFNPRSRSRVSENYMYVVDPRQIGEETAYGRPHNGSLV